MKKIAKIEELIARVNRGEEVKLNKKLAYNTIQNKTNELKNKNITKADDVSFALNKTYRNMHKSSNLVKTMHDNFSHKKNKKRPKII